MFTAIRLKGLPQVPPHLIKYDLDFDQGVHTNSVSRQVTKHGHTYDVGAYSRQSTDAELESWLKDNIVNEWANVGYGRQKGPCLGPHVERTRFYALQYVIETGGDNVQTVFYQPKSNAIDMVPTYMYVNNYDDLIATDAHVFPAGEWWLLDGMTFHSVENIQTVRITLQIGLLINPLDMILTLS